MALKDFDLTRYVPLLGLRPAEMQALQELPERDKDLLLPYFHLGPWATAHHLSSSLARIEGAFGERACFVSIAELDVGGGDRPVHKQLAQLRMPTNGYTAWCEFVEQYKNFIPGVQISDPTQISAQALRLHALGRGLIVPVKLQGFGALAPLARQIGSVTGGGTDVCFFLDFGRCRNDILNLQNATIGYAQTLFDNAPNCRIILSASSFPETFVGLSSQEIFERTFFNALSITLGSKLIYSDRASVRAERAGGGSGLPNARIDYAKRTNWKFFRSADVDDNRTLAYIEQAKLAVKSADWDPKLRVWGTQMIERTSLGDQSAIFSTKLAVAARINVHIHQQLFYDDDVGLYNTDDEWND